MEISRSKTGQNKNQSLKGPTLNLTGNHKIDIPKEKTSKIIKIKKNESLTGEPKADKATFYRFKIGLSNDKRKKEIKREESIFKSFPRKKKVRKRESESEVRFN